ncbi:hypothetical protein [Luteimonas sp. A537]
MMMRSSDSDFDRIRDHFPDDAEMTLQVLKGHLLVEEQLREIFALLLAFPQALRGARGASFECHQVICLVQAMTPHSALEPWLWDAAKRLNGIRNAFAHNLEPLAINEKIAGLLDFAKEQDSFKEVLEKYPAPPGMEFKAVVLAMCGALSALKDLVISERGSAA